MNLILTKAVTTGASPFCRPGYEPVFPKEDFLSGQGLLTSLCNLAMQINSFDNKITLYATHFGMVYKQYASLQH